MTVTGVGPNLNIVRVACNSCILFTMLFSNKQCETYKKQNWAEGR